jgi:hypothetical protein
MMLPFSAVTIAPVSSAALTMVSTSFSNASVASSILGRSAYDAVSALRERCDDLARLDVWHDDAHQVPAPELYLRMARESIRR